MPSELIKTFKSGDYSVVLVFAHAQCICFFFVADEPVRDEGGWRGAGDVLVRVGAGGHQRLLLLRPLHTCSIWVSRVFVNTKLVLFGTRTFP